MTEKMYKIGAILIESGIKKWMIITFNAMLDDLVTKSKK
jgi:hypothetical protein